LTASLNASLLKAIEVAEALVWTTRCACAIWSWETMSCQVLTRGLCSWVRQA